MKDRQFDGAFPQADVPPELLDGAILSGKVKENEPEKIYYKDCWQRRRSFCCFRRQHQQCRPRSRQS